MANLPAELDYNIHVKPILSDKCFACHGPDQAKQKAGLRLDFAKFAYSDLPKNKGKVAINPGDLADSELFHRIISEDPEYKMPSPESHLSLSNYEKAVLIKWINDGAEYKPHWAFVKPEKIDLPKVENGDWVKNPIDNFVLQKFDENKLKPNPEADKYTLIRRLSFDLTGLPPTIAETDAFVNDKSENAYEKVVDRLLKSPHYGERMAVDWLDLARFSDSHGYTVDRLRDMTPYRDWVIDAFNENMPYNQFVKWQLAGDMMPKPTKEMLIATAFNRNHPQNLEGGIVEKEFQTEYVMDRTNTFGQAFLGLSVGCARCHDHKYDPFSQKNYYELYSFFNNLKEAGQIAWDDTMPSPTMLLPTKNQEEILQFIKNNIAKEERNLIAEKPKFDADFKTWLQKNEYKNLAKSTISQQGLIAKFDFENNQLKNKINTKQVGFVTGFDGRVKEEFVASVSGKGLKLTGDAWFDTDGIGAFRKSDAFSIGIWVNIDKATKEGVIFNKTIGERLYNFKGFHVYLLENGLLEMTMAHAAPSNAITKTSKIKAPKGQWIQLTMTYDGSGKANGMNLYLNGDLLKMDTEIDQLIKDINYKFYQKQPGIMVGAWWRGNGLKNGLIDDLTIYNREICDFEVKVLANKTNWASIANKDYNTLNNNEIDILRKYFYSANLEKNTTYQNLKKLQIAYTDSLDKVQELMIMQESKPKQAYILARGNYDSPTAKVYPNTPESLSPFPENLPKNRLGLAEWLTNKENPLAARVVVNRLWQQFFGIGLVKTSEDFGNQGEMPSHLQLLDYLAVDFQENNWDVKRMVKAIVMSATYQQSSIFTKEMLQKDPENRLLARGPAMRLTAEMMRDNALFAAGILKNEIGGKSIKPYQPGGLWEINNTSYTPDSTDIVYKRSMYIVVKRSVLNPTLATFDGSSRSSCEIRRQKTNTPLQALVTQNDPTYLEASKILGEQMAAIPDERTAIISTYRKLTGKLLNAKELGILLDLQRKQIAKFKANAAKTIGWQKAGFYKLNPALDPVKIVANAVVANVIMNSDACLTKR
jgi:Protein of unknown function (DUF1549)/Protein of unknown function (DUF1553)/Concanavalin A-like lectin/glucanases superfamily/Planctomycete cytochrome C